MHASPVRRQLGLQSPQSAGRGRSRAITQAELTALVLLGLVIVGAPQLLGGVMPWAMSLTAFGALLALIAACQATRTMLAAPVPLLALTMCAIWLWTAVQAMPLPCSLVALLAPDSAASYRTAMKLLGAAPPQTCALSRDPGGTQQEIVKGIAIVATFLAAWMLAALRRQRVIIALIACSSLLMSVVALVHGALRLDLVFALYHPVGVSREFLLAPLMNPNNLGGFALLGIPIWLALARDEQAVAPPWLSYVAVALGCSVVLLSMSRGAISALLAVLAFSALLRVIQRPKRGARDVWRRRFRSLAALGAVAAGLGLGAYVLADRLLAVPDRDLSKLSLISSAFDLALRHPLVGIGRGAFSSVFAALRGSTSRCVYPENFVAQWAAEWGIPATAALALAIVHALVRSLRRAVSPERAGAAIGILALAAQNLVDLSFELVGVAVVAAATLAVVVAPQRLAENRDTKFGAFSMQRVAIAFAVFGAVSFVSLSPALATGDVDALERELRGAQRSHDSVRFRETLDRAVRLHPSEPIFAVLGAASALDAHDWKAGLWIQRAIKLAPQWATPHFQAFRFLWDSRRRDSALHELRSAAAIDPLQVAPAICAIARVSLQWVLQAAPQGKGEVAVLESAANCLPPSHPNAEAIDDLLIRKFDSRDARTRRAWRQHQRGKTDEALADIADVLRHDSQYIRAWMLRAQMLEAAGRPREAAAAADDAIPLADGPDRRALLAIEARARAKLGDETGLRSALDTLRGLAGGDPPLLAEQWALEGAIERGRGRLGHAFRAYSEAFEVLPGAEALRQMAEISEALGRRQQAAGLYGQLCDLDVSDSVGACAKRDALRLPLAP